MFFRDLRQDIYPTSSIRQMVFFAPPEHNNNAGYYEVTLDGGGTCKVSYETAAQLLRTSWNFVSAFPGVTLLERKETSSGNDPFNRTAVLAWGLDHEGALRPITGEGIVQASDWGVLTSDGLVSDKFGGSHSSEDSYLASLDEEEE